MKDYHHQRDFDFTIEHIIFSLFTISLFLSFSARSLCCQAAVGLTPCRRQSSLAPSCARRSMGAARAALRAPSSHARIERPAGRLWRPPSCGFHCVLEDPEICAYSRKGADFHCHPHSCRAHSSLQKIYIVSRIQGFTQSRSLATNGFTELGNSPPNVFLN